MSCESLLRALLLGSALGLAACGDSDSDNVGIHGAVNTTAHLVWLPHPDTNVMGYNVYVDPTLDVATTLVSNLPVDSQALNALTPSVEYNVLVDLRFRLGDYACFRRGAYNADGLSEPTSGVCTAI